MRRTLQGVNAGKRFAELFSESLPVAWRTTVERIS
jgi:hypothetical protein